MTELMKRMYGEDMLILDSTTGYASSVKEVFRVMYAEFIGKNSKGVKEYETMNMELYTNISTAYAVFSARNLSGNPEKEIGLDRHRFEGESLADILGDALKRKREG